MKYSERKISKYILQLRKNLFYVKRNFMQREKCFDIVFYIYDK